MLTTSAGSEGVPYLLNSPVYYFPWVTSSIEIREAASEMLDRVRPHSLGQAAYRLVFVNNAEDAQELARVLPSVGHPIGFDFETRGWTPKGVHRDSVSGVPTKTKGLSPRHPATRAQPVTFQVSWGLDTYVVLAQYMYCFGDWLRSSISLDYANEHFESAVFENVGIKIPRAHRDCIAMDFLLDETLRQRSHDLKSLAKDYLGVEMASFETTFKDRSFEEVLNSEPEVALSYAGQDALCTTLICDVLAEHLKGRPARSGYDSYELYLHWERPFHSCINAMQATGIPLSRNRLRERVLELEAELSEVDGGAYSLLGRTLNLSSTRELSKWYYGEQGKTVMLTAPGQTCLLCDKVVTKRTGYKCKIHGSGALVNTPSLDDEVLAAFAKEGDQLAVLLQRRRTVDKNRSTWMEGFYRLASADGWGFPSIRSTYVVSGRLSAGIWLTVPGFLRDVFAFHEEDPRVFIRLDYSQLELRLLAHVSGDETMRQAFVDGRDLHCWTGALLTLLRERGEEALSEDGAKHEYYTQVESAKRISDGEVEGCSPDALTLRQKTLLKDRTIGKAVNFGIAYGQSASSLATQLQITADEAESVYEAVWAMYPGVRAHYDRTIETTTVTGELRTLLGRNRKIPELSSDKPGVRAYGERLTKNTPCQAGGADVIRAAMILVMLDIEAGSTGQPGQRGFFGDWNSQGVWNPDWNFLPKGWRENMPESFLRDPGSLGRLGVRLSLQVHDELLLFCPEQNVRTASLRAKELMEDPFGDELDFTVPLVVSVGTGKNWDEAK